MALSVPERPWGAVKQTEENLRDVPLPRREARRALSLPPPLARPVPGSQEYQLDIKATNPLATLPVDVQEKVVKAKWWYEIASHPGATAFELALARAHLEELGEATEKPKEPAKEKPEAK